MIGMHIWHHGSHVEWELYLWSPPQRPRHYSECKGWSRSGTVPTESSKDTTGVLIDVFEALLSQLRDRDH